MEMELLLLLTICLLMFSGKTFGNETGHDKIIIKEDEDVILPCSLKTIHEDDKSNFDWKMDDKDVLLYESGTVNPSTQHDQFRGRVSHFQNGEKSENASIKIIKTKVSDSGQYTCIDINQLPPEKLNQVVLTVEYILKDRTGEKTTGAYAEPSVRTVNENDDWALLRCKVLGASPKPIVVLYNSTGNKVSDKEPQIIQNGNHYDVILETTVTKTDNYTCVATQEELHHQSNDTTFVHFGEKDRAGEKTNGEGNGDTRWSGGITLGIIIGVVIGVLIGVPFGIVFIRWRRSNEVANKKIPVRRDDTTNSHSTPLQNGAQGDHYAQNNSSGL
ncbi:butyrophilin-like protein 2 [Fundulus heteroclitus]|uniref:butyrophilin-like protein 2 n=1 Tax=Fundulus heteroclitus TaxID=8078 RepID=UPI00165B40C7|nr:butyrophilin-like protein 2 [Fundulus heteroclitus]